MSNKTPENTAFESLDVIQIRTPCQMDWDLMTGDQQARLCDRCDKNVYNISQMSEQAAISLIQEKEGNLCVRLFKRADGTVVTADCPPMKRLSEAPGRSSWLQFSMASLMMLVMASAGLCASAPWIGKKLQPYYDQLFGQEIANPPFTGTMVMGEMVVMPPPAAPTSGNTSPNAQASE